MEEQKLGHNNPRVGTRLVRGQGSNHQSAGVLMSIKACTCGVYAWAGVVEMDDGFVEVITDKGLQMGLWCREEPMHPFQFRSDDHGMLTPLVGDEPFRPEGGEPALPACQLVGARAVSKDGRRGLIEKS